MFGPAEEGVVGGDDLALRVQDDDAIIDAVDDGLQPFALITHLTNESGDRIGHSVELGGEPGQRVVTLRGDATLQVAGSNLPGGGFKALQPAQHEHANHKRDRAHQQKSQQSCTGNHPAEVAGHRVANLHGVVVENQNAIDTVCGVVASIALRPVPDRHHGAQNGSATCLDDPAGAALLRRVLMARLACGGIDPKVVAGLAPPRRVALGAVTIENHQLLDARLFSEALDHA